jgi:hypothetical protein
MRSVSVPATAIANARMSARLIQVVLGQAGQRDRRSVQAPSLMPPHSSHSDARLVGQRDQTCRRHGEGGIVDATSSSGYRPGRLHAQPAGRTIQQIRGRVDGDERTARAFLAAVAVA